MSVDDWFRDHITELAYERVLECLDMAQGIEQYFEDLADHKLEYARVVDSINTEVHHNLFSTLSGPTWSRITRPEGTESEYLYHLSCIDDLFPNSPKFITCVRWMPRSSTYRQYVAQCCLPGDSSRGLSQGKIV